LSRSTFCGHLVVALLPPRIGLRVGDRSTGWVVTVFRGSFSIERGMASLSGGLAA
jgi:hypothetical protein